MGNDNNGNNNSNEDQGINTNALHNLMFFIILVLLVAVLYFCVKTYFNTINPTDIERLQYYNTHWK